MMSCEDWKEGRENQLNGGKGEEPDGSDKENDSRVNMSWRQ